MNLKLGEKEFWALTPLEFYKLSNAYMENEKKTDARIGLLCAVVAEPNRDRKKHTKRFRPEDFMPKYHTTKEQTWQEQLEMISALNKMMGGETK